MDFIPLRIGPPHKSAVPGSTVTYSMKPETNTGFDASITVAQDWEAVVKTVEKLPPKFHFPPVKEP